MIVEISVVPIGAGDSLSKFIAEVLRVIESKGLRYELSSMGTVVEIENYLKLGELLEEINERLLEMGVGRVYMVIKADYKASGDTIERKKRSVREKLNKSP